MKFGPKKFCASTYLCTKFYENRSTIDHSSENHFNVHKFHTKNSIKLIFDTIKFYISRNNIAKICENRSIIYHSSHINPLSEIAL